MYNSWVELEGTIVAAQSELQTLVANRKNAEAMRSEAQDALEDADAAWQEAELLGDAAWRAFERGFSVDSPVFLNRLRVIREVDEARKSQAQLQRTSNVEAWREADRARKNATSDILKAISALAAASAQISREVRETTYLPGSANSLLDTALDDLRCAHAIGEELALLGQEALSRLGASSLVDQVRIDERLVEERVAREVSARQSEARRTEGGTTAFQEFRDRMESDATRAGIPQDAAPTASRQAAPPRAPEPPPAFPDRLEEISIASEPAPVFSDRPEEISIAPEPVPVFSDRPEAISIAPEPPPVFSDRPEEISIASESSPVFSDRPEEISIAPEPPPVFSDRPEAISIAPEPAPVFSDRPEEISIAPDLIPEPVIEAPMSAAEQLRREFENSAAAQRPNQTIVSGPIGGVVEAGSTPLPPASPPMSAAQELERELALLRTGIAGAEPVIESAPGSSGQPGVDADSPPDAAPTLGAYAPQALSVPESYSGRVYLMFPASLDQNQVGSVWEVLDEVAGSGAIVDSRLVSREDGVQFTLDLGNRVLLVDSLKRKMPGVGLTALTADRLKVDWPSG